MVIVKRRKALCTILPPLLWSGMLVLTFMFLLIPASSANQRDDAIINIIEKFSNKDFTGEVPKTFLKSYIDENASGDLILAVYTERQRLSAGIFAVQHEGRFYLPVGVLSQVFGFSVEVDPHTRSVDGWTSSTEESFSFDAASGKIRYQDQEFTLPDGTFLDAEIADDDVYVLLDVYNQIWPIEMEVDLSTLILRVYPDGLLPFQKDFLRKERQKKALAAQERKALEGSKDFPFIVTPYKALGKPALDFDISSGYNGRTNKGEHRISVSGVQDLGYASADYSISARQNGGEFIRPNNLRLRFRRQNIHEGALPLGVEDLQWGDVRLTNRKLISTGTGGRGIVFTTRENDYSNEFDLVTVDGVGTPGWETELYVNEVLIDFGTVDASGEYRFEDISIGYGNNQLRVVLYGPQGQRRERIERYFYDSTMLPPNKGVVSGGVVEAERSLIPIDKRYTNRVEGLAANIYGARGLTDNLTGFASLSTVRDRDGQDEVSRDYATVGVVGSLYTTLAQAEFYKEIGSGHALDIRTISDFKGFKVNSKMAFYSDFESPQANQSTNVKKREFTLNVKKALSTFLGNLGLEAEARYTENKNGQENLSYSSRQSLGFSGARFSNATKTSISNGEHSSTTGNFLSTTRIEGWSLKNSLNYRLYPDLDVASVQSDLRYGLNKDYTTGFSLGQNFDSRETRAGMQISRDFKKFLGSVDADWSSEYGFGLMLRASASVGPYAKDGDYLMQSQPLRTAGPISSFIYLDNDYDGTYSDGDDPVPDTKIIVGHRRSKEETNEEGYLTKIMSSVGMRKNISVDQDSIDDPYLVPAIKGYSIYPRPGAMHYLEFPLIETGAIDGTLRWAADRKPIAGLDLQLMNAEADIIQTTHTASDGYFTFERIPPGSYTIRADPETGVTIPFKYVEMTPGNLFQFGMDIDAGDLPDVSESGLDIVVADNAMLSVKKILSVAKGYKERRAVVRAPRPVKPVVKEVISPDVGEEVRTWDKITILEKPEEEVTDEAVNLNLNVEPAAGIGMESAIVPDVEKDGSAQVGIAKVEQASFAENPMEVVGAPIVNAVRVGDHPNKTRIVLDLSGPIDYSLSYDPNSNSIFVEMPYVTWGASEEWTSDVSQILNNYRIEKMDTGSRLILGVEDGVEISASGLLNASGDQKDRLYIDIEKK